MSSKATSRKGNMIYPSYNPTLVLRDAVRAAGLDPGEVPLGISYSNAPAGNFPLAEEQQDHGNPPTFEEALKHNSPGDNALPKYSPRTSGKGGDE